MTTDPTQWVKATASGSNGNCVEMRQFAGVIEVRDTKAHGVGPSLRLTAAEFSTWIEGAKNGTFDHLS
jgi:Domain of unknown function (DUF397)